MPLSKRANLPHNANEINHGDPNDIVLLPGRQKRAVASSTVKPTLKSTFSHTTVYLLKQIPRKYIVVAVGFVKISTVLTAYYMEVLVQIFSCYAYEIVKNLKLILKIAIKKCHQNSYISTI